MSIGYTITDTRIIRFDSPIDLSWTTSTIPGPSLTQYFDVTYSVNGMTTQTVASKTTTKSVSFTIPSSQYAPYITDMTNVPVLITITEYYRSWEYVVHDSVQIPITIPLPNLGPTIQSGCFTISPKNIDTSLSGYIQNYSKIHIAFNNSKVTYRSGATLAHWDVTYAGATTNMGTAAAGDSGTVTGSTIVVCTVVDSRGNTASQTFTITVVPYEPPAVMQSSTVKRTNSQGAEDPSGDYVSIMAICQASKLLNPGGGSTQNTLAVTYYYKAASASDYGPPHTITCQTTTSENYITASGTALFQATYGSGIMVKIRATDAIGGYSEKEYLIGQVKWFLTAYNKGDGAAFGKQAEYQNVLDIGAWKLLMAGGELDMKGATSGASAGDLKTTGDVKITGGDLLMAGPSANVQAGEFTTTGDINLIGKNASADSGSLTVSGGNLNLTRRANASGGNISMTGGGDLSMVGGGTLTTDGDITMEKTNADSGSLSITGGSITVLRRAGTSAGGNITIAGGGNLSASGDVSLVAKDANSTSGSLTVNGGNVTVYRKSGTSGGNITVSNGGGISITDNGEFSTDGDVKLYKYNADSGNLSITGGNIMLTRRPGTSSGGNLTMSGGGTFSGANTITCGTITATSSITSNGSVTASGSVNADGGIVFKNTLSSLAGGISLVGGNVELTGGNNDVWIKVKHKKNGVVEYTNVGLQPIIIAVMKAYFDPSWDFPT